MTIKIDPDALAHRIPPELHGQFIEYLGQCIDGGIWVGRDSDIPHTDGVRQGVLDALVELAPPVLRWPGGCYADTYHWRDGIGEASRRPVTFNENFGTYELDNHAFGTDEYLRLCEQIGAQPWINVNMMSGTVAEATDWMEYCNRSQPTDLARERAHNGHPAPYGVSYWGIGNEPWGGGGTTTAGSYLDAYRVFATAMPRFTLGILEQTSMYAIASGPDGNKPLERVQWTRDFFRGLAEYRVPPINGYDLHFYNWNLTEGETAVTFDEAGWDRVIDSSLELEDVLLEQRHLMDEGIAELPTPESDFFAPPVSVDLILGEWGNWHREAFSARPALFQQVTMRDAITTALSLDILHRNGDSVAMACNAQTVNVLNALLLTDGAHTIRTPNFDVFMMYKPHQGATAVHVDADLHEPHIHVFASRAADTVTINLVNTHIADEADVDLSFATPVRVTARDVLTSDSPTRHNTAAEPDAVRRTAVEVRPDVDTDHRVHLPARSVTVVRVDLVGAS
jgi:alpha-N-arabinofuranosidase